MNKRQLSAFLALLLNIKPDLIEALDHDCFGRASRLRVFLSSMSNQPTADS